MRLNHISYEVHGQTGSIALWSGDSLDDTNFTTVINGENGTGKSALLRAMADMSLGRTSSRQSGGILKSIRGSFGDKHPERVIALSGTINDRFPVTSGGNIRRPIRRFDLEEFYYFGPKISGAIASRARASSNIARAIFTGLDGKWVFGDGLSELMKFLELGSEVRVALQPNRARIKDLPNYFEKIHSELHKATGNLERLPKSVRSVANTLELLLSPAAAAELQDTLRNSITLCVDVASGELLEPPRSSDDHFDSPNRWFLEPSTLSDLLSLGVYGATVAFQSQSSRQYYEIEEMSSGQWQLINCLFGLCVFLADNSLVLVDEPENSLHPQWQRNYVSLIRKMVAHRRGCHVIIATHSPFLVSSLLPSEGNVVRLERDDETAAIEAVHEEAAYGWIPGDVLRQRFDLATERPPEFENALNSALQIMRRPGERTAELKTIARRLATMKENLPEHDTIRNVLDVIINTSGLDDDETEAT